MKMCEVCGKPIPRTKKLCEDCENGEQPVDFTEEFEEKENEFDEEKEDDF